MTVKVIDGKGSGACPQGYYALYEHPHCNGSANGRVLIADQSMDDHHMGPPIDFRSTATCVVNRSSRTLELFQRPGLQGERLPVPPGGPYDLRELKNENSSSLNDAVCSTRLGEPPSETLLGKFRKAGHQVTGGKVDQGPAVGRLLTLRREEKHATGHVRSMAEALGVRARAGACGVAVAGRCRARRGRSYGAGGAGPVLRAFRNHLGGPGSARVVEGERCGRPS
ncbi:hypothetical protein J7F03_40280 [Streptomyces sp. ISL-43]|nr:hypothetical protein [Streptomyces sp. ISL-43]